MCTAPLGNNHANPRHPGAVVALVDLADRAGGAERSRRLRSSRAAALEGGVMEIGYTNYTNLDACFARPYQCGDRLVRGYSGTIVTDRGEPIEAIAERLFTRHNHDDRPDGQLCPSMSVGDVVVIGEVAVSVDACGWCRVHPDQADVISDRSWRTVIGEQQVAVPHGVARGIVTNWATPAPSSPPPGCGVDGIGP